MVKVISIQKRGKVYQYRFEAARVNGKRKQITKSGFKTKNAAFIAGQKAYEDYQNGGCKVEGYMSYGDYLDYWLENYCKVNLKYRTIEEYSVIVNKYLKPMLGFYRLNSITSYQLNKYLIDICRRYDYSYGYFRNFVKVIKCSFRVATDIFGFINYNPSLTIKLPNIELLKKKQRRHVYTNEEIDLILTRFMNNELFTCLFITVCYTGMRPGEACALTWNDVNLEKRIITIKHNVYPKVKDEKGKWFIGTPKTDTSNSKYHYYHLEKVKNKFGKIVEHRLVESKGKNKNQEIFDLVFC